MVVVASVGVNTSVVVSAVVVPAVVVSAIVVTAVVEVSEDVDVVD